MSTKLSTIAAALLAFAAATAVGAQDLSSYSGAQLFTRYCASCHGTGGEGDGPVAPFFKLAPPDLTRIAARHGGRFPDDKMRAIVDGRENPAPHGKREMPVWGLEFLFAEGTSPEGQARAQAHIARLVEYLRSIQSP
ncbi:MAG TPA: cytochrome c [Steroidobacteraceae bacterium]|nr:cytochrome c [Steroidobacteraceae bacterium]